MLKISVVACAGLALAVPALAQTQDYIMVPHTNNGIMLFNAQDGSLAVESFIPKTGPAWTSGVSVLKAAVQVENEIWISLQALGTILRFDLNGNYYGSITENLSNCRGMWYSNGTVYVVNSNSVGTVTGPGVHRFDTSGNYLGGFPVGTAPWDVAVVGNTVHVTSQTNVLSYDLDGTPTGTFYSGSATHWQILPSTSGQFFLAGQSGTGARGIYEVDSSGPLQYLSTEPTGVRGMAPLGNGNFIWTSANNIHLFDTAINSSTIHVSGNGQHVTRLSVNTAAVGACCFLDGTCSIQSISDCGMAGGVFRGDATTCATANCPPVGACCFPDASCTLLPEDYCTMDNGIWNGAGSTCATVQCAFRLETQRPTLSSTQLGSGIFFDLTPNAEVSITQIDFQPTVSAGSPITVDLYTREGSYINFDWDPVFWTHLGTIDAISQGNTSSAPLTTLELPTPITIQANQIQGFYLVGTTSGYRYRSSSTPDPVSDANLVLSSDLSRSEPFSGATAVRRFGGVIHYFLGQPPQPCYANCDGSTTPPILNVDDFTCFINEFAGAQSLPHEQQISHYANCDNSTTAPVLNVDDFTCFINAFAQGCN